MLKEEMARRLEEIGLFLQWQKADPFLLRQFYNGGQVTRNTTEDLESLVYQEKIETIDGLSRPVTMVLKDLVLHDRSSYQEELSHQMPAGILEILRLPKLNLKQLRLIIFEKNLTTLAELEIACHENAFLDCSEFGGLRSQNDVLKGIHYLKFGAQKRLLPEGLKVAATSREKLQVYPEVKECIVVGSVARACEIIRDIDLLVVTEEFGAVKEKIKQEPYFTETLFASEKRLLLRVDNGCQVDLRFVLPCERGASQIYYTGSKSFTEALGKYAKTKGLALREKGIYQLERALHIETEEEVFAKLGLAFIPPELREGPEVIDLAEKSQLPLLVRKNDLQGALHVHTSYSDGADDLETMVCQARSLGFAYIGISDHSRSAVFAHGLHLEEIEKQQQEIAVLRLKYPDIKIFSGIEVDILPDGSLDYENEVLSLFDFVIASIHSHFKPGGGDHTERLLQAIRNPFVDIIGHISGRLLLGRKPYGFDWQQILEAAASHQVALEFNCNPSRLDLDWRQISKAMKKKVMISINSDAHRAADLGRIFTGLSVARKGGLTSDFVLNALDQDEVSHFFAKKRKERGKKIEI